MLIATRNEVSICCRDNQKIIKVRDFLYLIQIRIDASIQDIRDF
jgi:hypothetical protein